MPEPAARAAKPAPVAAPASPVTKAAVKTAAKQGAKVAARPAPLKTAPVAAAPKAARAAASTVVVAKPLAARVVPTAAPPAGKQKQKLVRDSFTIPKDEFSVLVGLKQRAGQLARHAKKSEILRAGVQLLSGLPDAAFLAALASVPSLKTGRPKQDAGSPAPGGGKKSAR
ncbi:MAG: hypothetical protein KA141_11140 [Rubrivivax sp.]|nr:hypothetical protein [Rubrivivax sp.]